MCTCLLQEYGKLIQMLREDVSLAARGAPHPCGPGCKCGSMASSAAASFDGSCVMCRNAGPGRPGTCCLAPAPQPFIPPPAAADVWQTGAGSVAASEALSYLQLQSQSGPQSNQLTSPSLPLPPPPPATPARDASRERPPPASASDAMAMAMAAATAAGSGSAQLANAIANAAQASLGNNGNLTAEQLHAREAKLGALRTIGKHLLAGAQLQTQSTLSISSVSLSHMYILVLVGIVRLYFVLVRVRISWRSSQFAIVFLLI